MLHRLGFDYRKPEAMPRGLDDAKQQAFIEEYENLLNTMGVDEAGLLGLSRGLPACASAVAAMKAIRASLTAFCMGSLVAPSKTSPLMTVRTITPRTMKARMVSVTSA